MRGTSWRDHGGRPNSLRHPQHDYRAGWYFVTLVSWRRRHVFGRVVRGRMILSPAGRMARECWLAIPDHFPHVTLGEFVVMPNHLHGIIVIHRRRADAGTSRDGAVRNSGRFTDGATHASPLPGTGRPRSPLPGTGRPPLSDIPRDPDAGAVAVWAATPRDAAFQNSGAGPGTVRPPVSDIPWDPDDWGRPARGPARGSLGAIIGAFKAAVARRVNQIGATPGAPLWQRGFHDRIILGPRALRRVTWYIRLNPVRRTRDRQNPMRR